MVVSYLLPAWYFRYYFIWFSYNTTYANSVSASEFSIFLPTTICSQYLDIYSRTAACNYFHLPSVNLIICNFQLQFATEHKEVVF